MIFNFIRSLTLLIALVASVVYAQDPGMSSELSAKALFYNASGDLAKVNSAVDNQKQQTATKHNNSGADGSVASAKRNQQRGSDQPLALRASVLLVAGDGKTVELKPSYKFRSGDRVKLAFSTNKAGYFYLTTIGSSGKVQILAPRPGEPVRVEAGNRYIFPSSPGGYFRFDSTKGQEEIWAVLSEAPLGTLAMGVGLVAQLPQQPGMPVPSTVVAVADTSNELGGKDLVFEEDSTALFASAKPVSLISGSNNRPPVIVKLKLQHE